VNARLREVIAGQATLLTAQEARIGMQARQIATQGELIAAQAAQLETLGELVEALQAQIAELERRLGMDSSNSSTPPSKDRPGAATRQRGRRGGSGRERGGQPGHPGRSLQRVAVPDRREIVEPGSCAGCGGGLDAAAGQVAGSVQVFDIAPVALSVTEYQMMRRVCPGCATATTAPVPAGVAGPVCYGPNVAAATTLLASSDVIGVARAANLMSALLAAPVSTGFVSRCLARLDAHLVAGRFEQALRDRLRVAPVLATDETPARVAQPGSHYVYTVRTVAGHTTGGVDLVWYGAADNRGHAAIDAFGLLPGYTGILVRDDYGGYTKYDTHLRGVQLCVAHLLRDLAGVEAIDPGAQVWATAAADALRDAATAVSSAKNGNPAATSLAPATLAALRARYDNAVAAGISTNLTRRWHRGNHPGLVLAKRLKKKASQVWTFTTDFAVPWTNNASEQSLRGVKVALKISGCWRTLTTLRRHCRARSYLTTARSHGVAPLTAIRDALAGNLWMPPHPT